MGPVGFSTGALAKGDFNSALNMQRRLPRIEAVELSALRDHELPTLMNAVFSLDLSPFAYLSVHAPSKLQTLGEEAVFALLRRLPEAWPIVIHPEILRTPSLWRQLGRRVCIENMDNRKTVGRTVEELSTLFDIFPEATFCLDLGHARQVDPTMASAILMIRQFGERLRQVHVSDVGPRGEHFAIGSTARYAFTKVARFLPAVCPLIIESIVPADSMEGELDAVSAIFDEESPFAAIA